jgi:hypothetical protein
MKGLTEMKMTTIKKRKEEKIIMRREGNSGDRRVGGLAKSAVGECVSLSVSYS